MKAIKSIFIMLATIVILVYTLPFIDIYLNPMPAYQYQSTDGKFAFTCHPSKGRDIATMEQTKQAYEKEHKVKLTICRKFKMKPLNIWEWYKYMNSPYYKNYGYCE